MTDSLRDKLQQLPSDPGVYIMTDGEGRILYIGKAKVLKNRVRQYFHLSAGAQEKVRIMMTHVADFRYIITASEADALNLENNLIKEHKPPYNILLKDDKHFPYVRLTTHEDFPRIEITRKVRSGDKARYFGPIGGSVKEFTQLLKEVFPIVSCKNDFNRLPKAFRPCLNYHLSNCLAPCIKAVTKEEYAQVIEKVIAFLKGDDAYVEETLTKKMLDAAENEQYEKALLAKGQLELLKNMRQKRVTNVTKLVDFDTFALLTDGRNTAVNVTCLRAGKVVVCENITFVDVSLNEAQALSSFLTQYYANNILTVREVAVSFLPENLDVLQQSLSETLGKSVSVVVPKRGVKKDIVDMAVCNVKEYLEKSESALERKYLSTAGAVEQLKKLLNLKSLPHRIECYDISNISGVDKVASMTVFVGGEKQPKLYRRFRIRTVEGANDFASMAEVVGRRLAKLRDDDTRFGDKPDLIVVDGGLGQLHSAQKVLQDYGMDIELISLAERLEEVFTVHDNKSILLPRESYALKLLINLRDEAHRFAITYFRTLHTKNALKSALTEIEGVGDKRQKILFRHFKTIEEIEKATVDELAAIEGISRPVAENVFRHFNMQ